MSSAPGAGVCGGGVEGYFGNRPPVRFASMESALLSVAGSMPSEDRISSVLQEMERSRL